MLKRSSADEDADAESSSSDTSDSRSDSDSDLHKDTDFEAFRLCDPRNAGLLAHNMVLSFVYGSMNAVLQGLFLGYLNVPAYLLNIAINICNLPLCFIFLFGMMSDSKPIFGRRRKPYMAIGWAIIFVSLLLLCTLPMPEPYYCYEPDGNYKLKEPPCNPDAQKEYVKYIFLLAAVAVGNAIADSAATGLMVEYAKVEPEETRGTAQATIQMVSMCSSLTAVAVVAFSFNGKMYLGSFDQRYQLTFRQLGWVLTVPSGITFALVCTSVREPSGLAKRASLRRNLKSAVKLMRSKAFFFIAMYIFGSSSIFAISTPAQVWTGLQWAGAKMLQKQLASILGIAASIAGTWVAKTYLLNISWRKITAWTVIVTSIIDAVPNFLTTYDVIRNQYFYLGEPIADKIPQAAMALVQTLMVNEVADEDNAGLVAGLTSTIGALGQPLSTVLSNQLFGVFKPSVSERANFIEDTPHFRNIVAWSFVISYGFSVASLLLLPLLPKQKAQAQQRKQEWPNNQRWACVTLTILSIAFAYSLLVDLISLDPSKACMKFVGGKGCQ